MTLLPLVCSTILVGCGTTKSSNTARTATEQLLISDAMDRAVSGLDFRAVAGKQVYLDAQPVSEITDSAYLVSTMRQHMLAAGCILRDQRAEADYIVELRAGAVGTDQRDLLIGVPATPVPDMIPMPGLPGALPEMPLAKKIEQRAVAKIAVFAYNQKTGRPVWQSGTAPVESEARDIWVLGAGPFQRGNIYEGTKFAGDSITIPLIDLVRGRNDKLGEISVADQAYFADPREQLAKGDPKAKPPAAATASSTKAQKPPQPPAPAGGVVAASHTAPAAPPATTSPSPAAKNAQSPAAPARPKEGEKKSPPEASKKSPPAVPGGAQPAGPATLPPAPLPEIKMLPQLPERLQEPLALPPKPSSLGSSYLPPSERALLPLFD